MFVDTIASVLLCTSLAFAAPFSMMLPSVVPRSSAVPFASGADDADCGGGASVLRARITHERLSQQTQPAALPLRQSIGGRGRAARCPASYKVVPFPAHAAFCHRCVAPRAGWNVAPVGYPTEYAGQRGARYRASCTLSSRWRDGCGASPVAARSVIEQYRYAVGPGDCGQS